MVVGALGTLIGLERAVALRQRWCMAAPLLLGSGGLVLLDGFVTSGALLMTLGAIGLVAVSAEIVRQHSALHTWTMAAGAVALLVGNLLWLFGRPLHSAGYWWAGFFVLVITGERLELSRVLRLSAAAQHLFLLTIGLFGSGLVVSRFDYASGMRIASLGAIAVALWLLRYDLARRNLRRSGLTRYIAANLVIGYVWLAVSGVLGVAYSPLVAGPLYDAWLHALFLGFVFGMIFAHAPIILPALLGVTVAFRPILYLAPLLLHLSLLLRIAADLTFTQSLRQWGGLLNASAILLYFALIATSVRRQSPQQP
jgi:hypothetical protein